MSKILKSSNKYTDGRTRLGDKDILIMGNRTNSNNYSEVELKDIVKEVVDIVSALNSINKTLKEVDVVGKAKELLSAERDRLELELKDYKDISVLVKNENLVIDDTENTTSRKNFF